MSEGTDPIGVGFELQRNAIEASRKALEESVEFQREVGETLVGGVGTTEDAQKQGVEMTRRALYAYLGTVESTVPGSEDAVAEIRETVDEQFDTLEARHAEAFESVTEELEAGSDTYEEFASESLGTLTEQLDALLETHEEIQTQLEERNDELADELDAGTEQFAEQFEAQLERFRTQLSEMQERVETTQREVLDAQGRDPE